MLKLLLVVDSKNIQTKTKYPLCPIYSINIKLRMILFDYRAKNKNWKCSNIMENKDKFSCVYCLSVSEWSP